MQIRCIFTEGEDEMSFQPFPGGKRAQALGCTCPYQPIPDGTVTFDANCPIHKEMASKDREVIEAADEIERLRAEIERMREALSDFAWGCRDTPFEEGK